MPTFREVGDAIARQAVRVKALPMTAARSATPMLVTSVREVFGHAPPLADLAESTQAERVALGYSANDPLVRTHALQMSWVGVAEESANGAVSGVGSVNPLALWQEYGFFNHRTNTAVPPRAAGLEGFTLAEPRVKALWKELLRRAITGD